MTLILTTMCSRYTLRDDKARHEPKESRRHPEIRAALRGRPPRFNVAPSQSIPAFRVQDGALQMTELRWGLIPSWAKDPKIAFQCLNARSETVAEKPAFRAAFKRRRCVVPADGYYEWTGNPGEKRPWWFVRPDHDLFLFAGLWESWTPPGGAPIETVSLLTTEASRYVSAIHHRMPVILEEGEARTWLDPEAAPEALLPLLRPTPEDYLVRLTMTETTVNNSRNEGPQCVASVTDQPWQPVGQICITTPLPGAQVYRLPKGLAPGTLVRTVASETGVWIVEEVAHPERRHRVEMVLLEVVGAPDRWRGEVIHITGQPECDWRPEISRDIGHLYHAAE